MAAIVDTSSWVSCARYFAPFDRDGRFSAFVKERLRDGELVLLDKVYEECQRQGKGVAAKAFEFMGAFRLSTESCAGQLPHKFYRMIDGNFQNAEARRSLDDDEYQIMKEDFMGSADFAIIAYAYTHRGERMAVITEESEFSNDGKPFKKIPAICKILGIESMTITDFLLKDEWFRMSVDYDSSSLF